MGCNVVLDHYPQYLYTTCIPFGNHCSTQKLAKEVIGHPANERGTTSVLKVNEGAIKSTSLKTINKITLHTVHTQSLWNFFFFQNA